MAFKTATFILIYELNLFITIKTIMTLLGKTWEYSYRILFVETLWFWCFLLDFLLLFAVDFFELLALDFRLLALLEVLVENFLALEDKFFLLLLVFFLLFLLFLVLLMPWLLEFFLEEKYFEQHTPTTKRLKAIIIKYAAMYVHKGD